MKPITHIRQVNILAGEKDRHSTLSKSKRLFDNANEPKKMWILKDAGHIDFSHFKPTEYRKRILAFFKENIS